MDAPFTHVFCEEFKVRVPFVADDFSAREAADRNDLSSLNEAKSSVINFAGGTYHFAS